MKDTTNNIMELTAVITALEYVLEILKKEKNYNLLLNNKKNDKKMNVEIYADSSYVLKGITEWIENWIKKDFKNVKNVELWKKLYNLKGQIEHNYIRNDYNHTNHKNNNINNTVNNNLNNALKENNHMSSVYNDFDNNSENNIDLGMFTKINYNDYYNKQQVVEDISQENKIVIRPKGSK